MQNQKQHIKTINIGNITNAYYRHIVKFPIKQKSNLTLSDI